MDLSPFAYWDCGLESHRGYRCYSLVNVAYCQVEFSASDYSFGGVLQHVLCQSYILKLREKRDHDWNTSRNGTERKIKKYNGQAERKIMYQLHDIC